MHTRHYYTIGGVCVSEFGMKQVLSGEKQQSLQDQLAALEASRQALRQNNTFLEGKVHKTSCDNNLRVLLCILDNSGPGDHHVSQERSGHQQGEYL